jgi:hypothetical protein
VDPVLELDNITPQVDPGGEARVSVTVRNIGELVEQYRFEVLGEAARWSLVEPRQVSVLPLGQEDKTVEVIFRPPPPPLAPAGEVPFGVRCISLERRDRCAVVEGDVAVGAVHNLTARLESVNPTGRRVGRYRVHFQNSGTVPVKLTLTVADEKRMLRTALAPKEITVPPARTAVAYLALRPKEPKLRGKPISHNFTVGYRAVGEDRSGELSGTFEQRPTVGKGLVAFGALAGLGAIAATALILYNSHKQKNAAAPQAISGPPPAVQIIKVEPVADGTAQIQYEHSPYGAKYLVQRLLNKNGPPADTKEVDEPNQSVFTYPDLKPGPACFQVVVVGTNGQRSAPSAVKCATIPVPKPTATPAPTSAASSPASSAPASSAPPTAGGPDGVPPVSTGGGDTGAPLPQITLTGSIAIYADAAVDDPGSRDRMKQVLHDLQQKDGVSQRAQLIDSRQSDRIDDGADGKGLWVVLQDGFPTYAAAKAECDARPSATLCTAK